MKEANDKAAISAEVAEIGKEVKSIMDDTQFNGKTVFGASDAWVRRFNSDDETTSHNAATENDHGCEYDLPRAHQAASSTCWFNPA